MSPMACCPRVFPSPSHLRTPPSQPGLRDRSRHSSGCSTSAPSQISPISAPFRLSSWSPSRHLLRFRGRSATAASASRAPSFQRSADLLLLLMAGLPIITWMRSWLAGHRPRHYFLYSRHGPSSPSRANPIPACWSGIAFALPHLTFRERVFALGQRKPSNVQFESL